MSEPTVIEHEVQFDTEVLGADGLVLVGLCADWSGACHIMAPVLDDIARELKGRATVVLVDIDCASWIKKRYGVESVPALLYFRHGRLEDQILGTVPKKKLAEKAVSLLEED